MSEHEITERSDAGRDAALLARLAGRERVLVGVDGSEDGLRGVRYGAREALAHNALLHLVHAVDDAVLAGAWGVVYDPSILQDAGETAIQQALEAARQLGLDDDQIVAEVVLGNASGVLSRLSQGARMTVVGRRSLSGLERMFVGSTSVSVAMSCRSTLVVISHAATPALTGDKGRLVVAIEAGSHSAATLGWAVAEAAGRGSRGFPTVLEVVHVVSEAAAGSSQVLEAAASGIESLLAPLREEHPEVKIEVELVRGSAVDVLVQRTATADLFVMGVAPDKSLGLLGGVMRGVLAHAQCPVALVR